MFKSAALFLGVIATASASPRDLQGSHSWAFDLRGFVANFGRGQPNQFAFTYTNGDSLTDDAVVIGSIWDPTCTDQINVEGLTASESTVDQTLTTSNVTVDFSSLGSAVWSNFDATTGQISFCYRSEIKIAGHIMNFDETIVNARVDRTNEINPISSVSVANKVASVSDDLEASVEYELVVYVCDVNDEKVTLPVPAFQVGGSLKICITLPAITVAGVTLASVYDAKLSQNVTGIESQAISAGAIQNTFTITSCSTSGLLCKFETTLIGAFFNEDENALSVSGTCLLAIGRRMLEVPLPSIQGSAARNMVEATAGRGEFDVTVSLAAVTESTSSASGSGSSSSNSALLAASSTIFALLVLV